MTSVVNQKATSLDRILVIDDLPIIPLAFQDIFRSINPAAIVEYSENVFTALSAKAFANMRFDLIITGSLSDTWKDHLQQGVTELRRRFGQPLIMLYSGSYDPVIIEKMAATGIDAYV